MANSDSNGRVSMILPCTEVISGTHYVSATTGHSLDCLHSVSVDRVSVSHTPWIVLKRISKQTPQSHSCTYVTANLMTEACDGVAVEPLLQPLTGEQFSYTSAITDDNAQSDICAQGVWGSGSQRSII